MSRFWLKYAEWMVYRLTLCECSLSVVKCRGYVARRLTEGCVLLLGKVSSIRRPNVLNKKKHRSFCLQKIWEVSIGEASTRQWWRYVIQDVVYLGFKVEVDKGEDAKSCEPTVSKCRKLDLWRRPWELRLWNVNMASFLWIYTSSLLAHLTR